MGNPPVAWLPAADGYDLALVDGKLACRNAKGTVLKSVPKAVRETECAADLIALRDFLKQHETECRTDVEQWMVGSLSVPSALISSVWADPSWERHLRNLVVIAADVRGLLRGVDSGGRVGVVDIDGETRWLEAERVHVPHPIDIPDLADFQELLAELGETQGVAQLSRQVYPKPADVPVDARSIADFSDGKFEQLRHATSRATSNGFAVRGGFAVCPVFSGGERVQARYWIGSDDPESPAWTGELMWVDADEKSLPVAGLEPVAYSEGVRMAQLIYAGRKVADQTEE